MSERMRRQGGVLAYKWGESYPRSFSEGVVSMGADWLGSAVALWCRVRKCTSRPFWMLAAG
jgi:hypothetical protein